MEDKKSVIPASIGADGDDIATWALPEGAVARLGQGEVETIAFSPDGHYLAVGTRVGLWWYEVETMSPVALWGAERGVFVATFSPNGKWIATSDWENLIEVWDVQQGLRVTQIETEWNHCTFSPNSQQFATSDSTTGTVNLWHPETGEPLEKFRCESEKGGRFVPIAFSPDTHLLASTGRAEADSDAESIIVWNTESGEQVACLTGHTGSIYRHCFSPCGRFLASGGEADGTVRVWDTVNWQQIQIYTDYGEADMNPSYSPEGVLRATAISYIERFRESIITVWDLESDEKLYSTIEDIGGVWGTVRFSKGSRLAHESGDGGIKVWFSGNSHTQESDYQPTYDPYSVVFSADGKTLGVESRYYAEALLWDIESKRPQPTGGRQHLFTFSNGDSYIVSISEGTVTLLDIENIESPIVELTGHGKAWVQQAFTSAANLLACADEEGAIVVWNAQSGHEKCKLNHQLQDLPHDQSRITLLEFSPDGRFLLSQEFCGKSARLWDVEQGEEIQEFPGDKVGNVGGFSPCGLYVACSGEEAPDYMLPDCMLWDVSRREVSAVIQDDETSPKYFTFAFSPCGSYLACGGELRQTEILLWNV
ncbi:MAG: WD40 repeat domain-containing protein, partial [Proteobacteria bacterium]|nr:WD40 repeat domain-containing protein [Pseudomonadota bacterium]